MGNFDAILDILSPNVFVPVYNYLKKDDSLKYVAEVERFNKLSLEDIHSFQLNRIRIIAEYASKNIPYYAKLFKKIGLDDPLHLNWDDYARIPLLTKDIIRQEKSNLVSRQFQKCDLRETATGGTTAAPIPFFSDFDSMYRKRSATIVFDKWLGYQPGMKSAYLWGASQDFAIFASLKQKLSNILIRRCIFLPGTPLDDQIMEGYYHKLRIFKPILLQSYPAPLDVFADFLERKSYHLTIPAISCTAEPLMEKQKKTIAKVFGKVPCNWYGAREAGRIATECHVHDGMHINSHGIHLAAMPSGYCENNLGSLVLTDLWNVGMPLIRYEIGDVGYVTEECCLCGCQLPRLQAILGRVTDTFMNSKGQKIPGVGFTNRYIKDVREIISMQIIQHDIKDFEILVVPTKDYSSATVTWLQQKLNEFMQEPTGLRVTTVEQIPREKSGKVRFCKNLMA